MVVLGPGELQRQTFLNDLTSTSIFVHQFPQAEEQPAGRSGFDKMGHPLLPKQKHAFSGVFWGLTRF